MADIQIIKKMWGIGDTSNIPLFLPYGIYGFQITVRAYELNPSAGVYNFESVIGSQLDDIVASGLQGGILLTVGQNTPTYKLTQVGSFTTSGGGNNGPYPYYFNPVYISWYYDLYKRLFDFINSCSAERKAALKYIQVAEGSTGDAGPYKGTPTNYNWNGQTSISNADWSQFRKDAWAQFNTYNLQNASFCTILLNPGNDNEDTDYIQDNYPTFFLKNGIVSHQIGFNGETATLLRIATDRGEMQNFFDDPNWSIAALQMNWTIFCSFIALQLDMPDSPTAFLTRGGGGNNDLWDFGNRYLGITTDDGIGMIALRDMIDFSDTTRFSEGTYGALIDPSRLTQYNNRVNQLTSLYGTTAPTYLAFLLNDTIANFLNPARVTAIEAAVASTGATYDPGNPYGNDMGVGLLVNYEKFITQFDPANTSRGWYRLGPINSSNLYGRFARSTDHANSKDEMFFIVDPAIIGEKNYTVTVRITYYNNNTHHWDLKYRDEYGPATAFTQVDTGTNEWLQKTFTISNLEGKAHDNASDFSIAYNSGGDVPVALVEIFDVIENVMPDVNPPTVVIDTVPNPYTIYQPDNSVAVEATATPAYLHSIASVLWEFISGPSTYTISNPATLNTTFGNLIIGAPYTFRITVTQDDSQTASADFVINVVSTLTGTKYIVRFLNRQEDIYRVELKPKNYSGIDKELTGTDKPFELKYQSGDGDIYSPIRASEATVQFWSDGNVSIEDFYNDDNTFWQVLFYGEKIKDQDAADVLLWNGFLQLDNSGEDLQDRAHVISLNANDNLGLLKNVALPTPTSDQVYEGILLTELFASILGQSGLALSVNAYLNIFENSTDDRTVLDTNDFLQQTIVYTSNLQNSDGSYRNCFDILNQILNAFRVSLFQAKGAWNFVRQSEYRLFANAQVPGTAYNVDMEVQDAIVLDSVIDVGRNLDIIPINENQIKRILAPYQLVKKTFNYSIPAQLILQSDLSLPIGATPYHTNTVSGIRYDDYSIATYFPYWKHIDGDTSYLEVATDVATGNEVERYIVTPAFGHDFKGVQFNNIPVTAGDSFDFSLQFRTFSDSPDTFHFRVRLILVTDSAEFYNLTIFPGVGSDVNVHWTGPFPVANWDLAPIGDPLTVASSANSSQYIEWRLGSFIEENGRLPLIPADGILLITVQGNNDTNLSEPEITTLWKSVNINFTNAINKQINIIGQVHTQTQDIVQKNNSDTELNFDDSPRNTIEGTLLRTSLVDFQANIGELYFYRTLAWHRVNFDESLRLNQIQTFDQLFIQRKIRTIIEGDFRGLRYETYDGWKYLSVQNILKINFLQTLNFIFGIVSFDYMRGEFNATLYECFDDVEVDADLDNTYEFKYLYKNT